MLLAYRAAGEPHLWPQVMDKLSDRFGGNGAGGAVIEAHDRQTGSCAVVTGSKVIAPEDLARYENYFAAICPRLAASWRLPPDIIHHDDLIGDESVLDRSEYYTDFLGPQGYRYFIGANIVYDPLQRVIVSVQRPKKAGRVDRHDIEDFDLIRPHLSNAFALYQSLEGYKGQALALKEIFDRLDRGVALVNKDGEILFMNTPAENMVADHSGLLIWDRRLSALDPGVAQTLDDMVKHAIEAIGGSANGNNQAVRIAGASGHDLLLRTVPLPRGEMRAGIPTAVAAMLIEALPPRRDVVPARLRTLYGLTPTESELAAAFAEGATLDELAERRGVTIATIRTHFVRIREKFGARNLAELMRLILASLPSERG